MLFEKLKRWAWQIKQHLVAVYLVSKSAQVSYLIKILAFLILAYAVSPIDLIPDFIPIIGYLDDLILLPIGIMLVILLVPKPVWHACLAEAKQQKINIPLRKAGIVIVLMIWLLILAVLSYVFLYPSKV